MGCSSRAEAAMSTTEYYCKFNFFGSPAGSGDSQVPFPLSQKQNLHNTLRAARGKISAPTKQSASAQILQSTNPLVLENTGKAHTIQKLAGMSIAKGKVAGKRKKTNRKCHTQRIQHKLRANQSKKKKI